MLIGLDIMRQYSIRLDIPEGVCHMIIDGVPYILPVVQILGSGLIAVRIDDWKRAVACVDKYCDPSTVEQEKEILKEYNIHNLRSRCGASVIEPPCDDNKRRKIDLDAMDEWTECTTCMGFKEFT